MYSNSMSSSEPIRCSRYLSFGVADSSKFVSKVEVEVSALGVMTTLNGFLLGLGEELEGICEDFNFIGGKKNWLTHNNNKSMTL